MLFFTFVAAVLVMVLAVWLAAVVGQWWILIPVVAVDLIVTTAVTSVVIWMLADGPIRRWLIFDRARPPPDSSRALTAAYTPASPHTLRKSRQHSGRPPGPELATPEQVSVPCRVGPRGPVPP